MRIGVRELRNRTRQVIEAVRSGERVTLTVRGDPVADIVPHGERYRWLAGDRLRTLLELLAADTGLQGDIDEAVGQTWETFDRRARRPPGHLGLHRPGVRSAPLKPVPERVAVLVVTIGELQLGALTAATPAARQRRAATLALARTADPLPVSAAIMVSWARLVADCRATGFHKVVTLTNSLIGATAVDHGLPVVTQDSD